MPVVGALACALAIGVLVTWIWASGEGWRWGCTIERRIDLGEGTYRRAPVDLMKPRRLPFTCGFGAVTSVAWGVLTLLTFAPAGLVFFVVSAPFRHGGLLHTIGIIGALIASGHGFLLGMRLIGLVTALAIRTEMSVERIQRAVIASAAHHILVLISFAAVAVASGKWPLFAAAALPCAIGLAHACLLARARDTFVRLDREDRQLLAR